MSKMLVIHEQSLETFDQGDQIQLFPHNDYHSTYPKTPNGRWYYEINHLSGNNAFVIGFVFDNIDQITLAPNCEQYPYIYAFGNNIQIDSADNQFEKISFPIPTNSTIGFGIDVEKKLFSVIFNKTSFSYHYQLNSKPKSLDIIVREASADNMKDNCTVNLGKLKFINDIPYGYLAWQETFRIISCKSQRHTSHLYIFIILIQ